MSRFIVGLTGGIGSGKSTVGDTFAELGIDCCDADQAARAVVLPGSKALEAIARQFGKEVLNDDGSMNRGRVRQQVFATPDKRKWLEQLLHPLIREELLAMLQRGKSPYALLISPLLMESGQNKIVHRILVVDIPESLQVQRTASRDNSDQDEVKRIMAAQMSRSERLSHADDVIDNSKGTEQLSVQVDQLHQHYLQLARDFSQGYSADR